MNVFKKAKYLFSNNFDEMIKQFLRGDEITGSSNDIHINETTAMKYSAVFACCRVLSETVASTPIKLYRKTSDGREEVNEKIYDVLHNKPNEEMTAYNFWECNTMQLNLGGNAFCEKIYNRLGEVIELYPYLWHEVQIKRNDQNKLIYIVSRNNQEKILTRDKMFHIPGLTLDGIVGLSPIEYAAGAIKLGLTYETFCNNFYKNGAHATGAFEYPNELGDEGFLRLQESLKKSYGGLANAGKPMILEDGGKFHPFTINPVDAQLLESKNFQIEDICRIYRVPQHLINKLDRSTNNNIEHQSLEFIMYTMMPWFKRIETNANIQLLTDTQRAKGYYFEFKVDALLRGDAKSRAEAYGHGRQWGWLSVNDIRRLENMPTLQNGDVYLQPSNMMEAGKEVSK